MATAVPSRRGPTLAERHTPGTPPATDAQAGADPAVAALQDRSRPVLTRHCWVSGLSDCPGRWAGLLAEWRPDPDGGWQRRVVYAVDDGGARTHTVEAWVHARHLHPAAG